VLGDCHARYFEARNYERRRGLGHGARLTVIHLTQSPQGESLFVRRKNNIFCSVTPPDLRRASPVGSSVAGMREEEKRSPTCDRVLSLCFEFLQEGSELLVDVSSVAGVIDVDHVLLFIDLVKYTVPSWFVRPES
jgi:hypothetical protein